MCHLILMLPLLALPIFWLMPLSTALPVYSVVVLLASVIYLLAIRAMRRPVETGYEEILKSTGQVIDIQENITHVRVHSEIWNAISSDKLCEGDRIKVVSMDGLTLKVQRID